MKSGFSRRRFLKTLLAGGAAATLPQVSRLIEAWAASPVRGQTGRLRRWVMVIDLALCDGCKKCTEGQAYRYKEELGTEPRLCYLPPRTG